MTVSLYLQKYIELNISEILKISYCFETKPSTSDCIGYNSRFPKGFLHFIDMASCAISFYPIDTFIILTLTITRNDFHRPTFKIRGC